MASSKPTEYPLWEEWKANILSRAKDEALTIIETLTEMKPMSGGRWRGKSPWRKERTASFDLHKDGGCHDYGDGTSTDAIGALMRAKNLSFREAMDEVAVILKITSWEDTKKQGSSPGLSPDELEELHRWQSEERSVQELMTRIVHVCHRKLPSKIRAFIHKRYGLSDETIDCEKIGWISPGLFEFCEARWPEITLDEWLATGFFHKGGHGVSTFNDFRTLFPYWRKGFVVYTIARECEAFGPMAIHYEWEKGKYKKHAQHGEKFPYISTTISNRWFWNEDVLDRRVPVLLVTEGISDAMSAKQIGIPVISPVTISFRDEDMPRLTELAKKYVRERTVVINDNDELPDGKKPGKTGALKTARYLWLAGQRCGIGTLPKDKAVAKYDMNDFIRDHLAAGKSEDEVQKIVETLMKEAVDYPEFLLGEIPKDTSAVDLGKHLGALAEAMVPMKALARADYERSIKKRFREVAFPVIKRELDKHFKKSVEVAEKEGRVVDGMDRGKTDEGNKKPEVSADGKQRKNHEGFKGAVTIHEEGGFYERMGTSGKEQISTFHLILTRVVRMPLEPDRLVVRVEGPDEGVFAGPGDKTVLWKEWVIPHKAWSSKRNFISAFPTPTMQWSGGDDEVQGALALLADASVMETVPLVSATPVVGRHKAPDGTLRFVLPVGTLQAEGWMEDPDVLYLPTGSVFDKWLLTERAPVRGPKVNELAREVLPLLLQAQPPEVAVTALTWAFASLFTIEVRKRVGGFPLLSPWGLHGSGKSTFIVQALGGLFYERSESVSVKATSFAIAKTIAYVNAIPVIFDEYKPSDMGRAAEPFRRRIRTAYSGETEMRGHMDQTISDYPLQAPLIIAGETRIEDDPALIERTLYAPFTKAWVDTSVPARKAMERLRELPLWKLGPALFAWSLTADVDRMLSEAKALWNGCALAVEGHEIPTRMANNMIVSLFGLIVLRRWAIDFEVELPTINPSDHVQRMLAGIYESPDGETDIRAPLDACDLFIMRAHMLIVTGEALENVHWAHDDSGRLALPIPALEALAQTSALHRGTVLDSPGVNALRRAFREKKSTQINGSGYILETSHKTWMKKDGQNRIQQRCVVIDVTKIPISTGLTADSFPKKEIEIQDRRPTAEELVALAKRTNVNRYS